MVRKITGHRSRELERYQHLSPLFRAQTVDLIAQVLVGDTPTDTPAPRRSRTTLSCSRMVGQSRPSYKPPQKASPILLTDLLLESSSLNRLGIDWDLSRPVELDSFREPSLSRVDRPFPFAESRPASDEGQQYRQPQQASQAPVERQERALGGK